VKTQEAFKNIDRARQLVLFDRLSLACGKQATDIDYSTDLHGRVFVFGDFKYGNAPCPLGQKMHLRNKVEAIRSAKPDGELLTDGCAFIARHNYPIEQDIDPNDTLVTEYFWRLGKWIECREPVPFKGFVDAMIQKMNKILVEPF
jgi:hypothetical protein